MFAPDLQINGLGIRTFNHLRLREATVEHLRNRSWDIYAVSGHGHEHDEEIPESVHIPVLTHVL
jgi:hypothetical protein